MRSGACAAVVVAAMAGSALAQGAGFGDITADGPIEIAADELEVRRAEGLAVFRGAVDAVQGELRLTADELRVFYAGDAGDAGGAGGDIERVVASGDVVVRSPRDVARGSEATYDLATQRIIMTGDVVLTRDDNVIRGSRLDVDLASGVSTMRAAGEGGRVRALFQPQNVGGS